jgi:hypothetical protein
MTDVEETFVFRRPNQIQDQPQEQSQRRRTGVSDPHGPGTGTSEEPPLLAKNAKGGGTSTGTNLK